MLYKENCFHGIEAFMLLSCVRLCVCIYVCLHLLPSQLPYVCKGID